MVINVVSINQRKFSIIILSVHLVVWGAIGLNIAGFNIPVLTQFIGFIYLTFVPGILVIQILNLTNIGKTQIILFSVGISLALLMYIGLIVNVLLPIIGISEPISLIPLLISLNLVTLSLWLGYILKSRKNPNQQSIRICLERWLIPFAFIPIMSVIGTFCVNYLGSNILLLFMIVYISLLFLIVICTDYVPTKIYPYIIWTIAISLIWHRTLISEYVNVSDVVGEYIYASAVISRFFWNWADPNNYNAVLSINVLQPYYYFICDLDLVWVFKLIDPFFLSLVPVAMYILFLRVTNCRIAFLATFLAISISPFYGGIALIVKQAIAELFVVLILIILCDTTYMAERSKFHLLLMLFISALIFSHYGTSYLMVMAFILVYCLIFTIKHVLKCKCRALTRIRMHNPRILNPGIARGDIGKSLPVTILLFFIVGIMAWYMFVANSVTFNQTISMGKWICESILTEFFDVGSSRGLYTLLKDEPTLLWYSVKGCYVATQVFLIIGFAAIITYCRRFNFNVMYISFSVFFIILLGASLVHTSLSAMDPRRTYQLALVILAPYSIIGGLLVFRGFEWIVNQIHKIRIKEVSVKLLTLFLILFFWLNSGFLFEITKDQPSSISISQESMLNGDDMAAKARYYSAVVDTSNVFSGKWLGRNMEDECIVYRGDIVQGYPSLTIYGGISENLIQPFGPGQCMTLGDGYVQVSSANIVGGIGSVWYNALQIREAYDFREVSTYLLSNQKIYSNGNSHILLYRQNHVIS